MSEDFKLMNEYWMAANYLSVGQIYLLANPLLRTPLEAKHIKARLLGHWGTTPGLNFIYVHLNRIIKKNDLNILYITGPGHGGPGLVANSYLEGVYSEVYPNVSLDEEGMRRLFKQFSFPGGIPSHVAAETPGSIHEGGELGYALSHAFGAVFDNPDLIVACVVGDGEAETGPLATSWHSNKFLNPTRDGAVLPILHLNGYKIAGPCVLARIPHDELEALFKGYGYKPYFVEGDDPMTMHKLMAQTLDACFDEIRRIQTDARTNGFKKRVPWPMIVLRSPKGWTGPKTVDGKQTEGTFRSHQVPMANMTPAHIKVLSDWMLSYKPQELFDAQGECLPIHMRMVNSCDKILQRQTKPWFVGGMLLRALRLPEFAKYQVAVTEPGSTNAEATRIQGEYIRDVIKLNPTNFRVFSPDETSSNRWNAVFDVTQRCSTAEVLANDEAVGPDGRVMEMLSEHQMEGWLEGYLLTGRHGFFSCYEAFIHIVDSMFNQHAKWLKVCNSIEWRRPVASLNYLLTSHVWRQEHNGSSHEDPGFIDHVINKKGEVIRVYLPPDANTLLVVTDICLRSRNCVNVVVAGKQPAPQYLDMDAAIKHVTQGFGIFRWASNDSNGEPDVVMACAGDVPTLETLAAVKLLRGYFPWLKVRVVNVVNLMKLQPPGEHPHAASDKEFDMVFGTTTPVVFAYHGYPWLIHRLTYRRHCHSQLHVRGFKEEGTTTTPFDMAVLNDIDRFHLALDVIERVAKLSSAAHVAQELRDKLVSHKQYIQEYGIDMPEILNFTFFDKDEKKEKK